MERWRGAAALCVNEDGQLLMVLQGRPDEEKRWSVPSGGMNPGETEEACCVREVWEETGYKVKVGGFLHAKTGISRGTLYTVGYYKAQAVAGEPTLHDPDGLIYDIRWKTACEISELPLTYPEDRRFLLEIVTKGYSEIVYRSNPLCVRKLSSADAGLLQKWLNDPEVLRYYDGRDRAHSAEKIRELFYPDDDRLQRAVIEHDGAPIGYVQWYELDAEARQEYGLDAAEDGRTFGMDQFIGEPFYWNRGIGQHLMKSMLLYLSERQGGKRVLIDPQCWNERAIACYMKSGFRKVKLLPAHEWHEGCKRDCWLMEALL